MNEVFLYLDNLLKNDDIVVVGCSGGPDSMALLNILMKYRDNIGISIICCHINHNVRNESYDEMKWLENYCASKNIVFEGMTIENYGEDNFENEARNIRYNFFEEIVKKYSANFLMTAHHGDDLIETVLMKIVRGSNLSGYSGFKMDVDKGFYRIIRPLIFTTKDELVSYDNANNIDYVIDKTNFMDIHTRNRYRRVVLPFLKNEDKNVHKKFLKYSNTLIMYDNYINEQIKSMIDSVYNNHILDIIKFKKAEDIFKTKIIYLMLEDFYQDDMILINDVHVDLVINLINSNKSNGFVNLPNNVKVVKKYGKLYIDFETKQIDNYEIKLGNSVLLPNNKTIERVSFLDKNDNCCCRLNSADIVLPIIVRTRKSGDKMCVKNMNGTKKVKDIFIDSKIPIAERDSWPIVVDSSDNVLWIPGIKKSKFDIPKNKKCDIILWYK